MATAENQTMTNIISGKVLEKESGRGIPDLLVELFDLEAWADPEGRGGEGGTDFGTAASAVSEDLASLYKVAERVGSTLTDRNGEFLFQVGPKDFNLKGSGELKPDLFIAVSGPDEPGLAHEKRLLHMTRNVYLNAGRREAYIIRLPSALLAERGIGAAMTTAETDEEGKRRAGLFISADASDRLFDKTVLAARSKQTAEGTSARKSFRTELKAALAPRPASLEGDMVEDKKGAVETKSKSAASKSVGRFNKVMVSAGEASTGGSSSPAPGETAKPRGIPVNLYLTPEDLEDGQIDLGGPEGSFVAIDAKLIDPLLFGKNSSGDLGTLLIQSNPIAAFCAQESFEETCAKIHTGLKPNPEHEHDEAVGGNAGSGSSSGTGSGSGTGTSGTLTSDDEPEPGSELESIEDEDVSTFLARLLRDMPSPDRVLNPDVKRANQEDLQADVDKFALPKGPAELPAKYYFSTLDIAFDHVWKQLFDEEIPDLAYTADDLGGSRLGAPGVIKDAILQGYFPNVMFLVTPVEVPPGVARHFDVTKEEYNELTQSARDELRRLVGKINALLEPSDHWQGGVHVSETGTPIGPTPKDIRTVQRLIEQGDRLIESVRHDDHHSLHKTLQELQQRLTNAYEFTVFAADKDYHSVNFGLLCTYEQEWTPLAIQPGRLVKTIPLAPKEERRYTIRSKRTEKRASKEARKHNQSMTSEQNSVSRVEAEIVAKANSKSNFSHSGEFGFQVGVYSGKASHTFGMEATKESSQNRKDFRESVLKAAQEIKDEFSVEIATDSEFSFESEESGLIANNNEELSVTHLFYELQKRYRLAERLYRVMPVVLVAQEVPSPDKITPAWVIAHDWILRRTILDDSFRPALDYLASNSVGDDYALREMRKNLRQQRNMVETLRIEFSAASVEADNRYTALARKIEDRIDEERAERTDGFFSDVGDWFGGDGQDPEAAKARELAAKDAHQYALEKAEKAAAALRQEMGALHQLTDAYSKTVRARLDNETRVKRLLVHLRNNILYYMQAIWTMEPPDQQLLRLHKVQVPILNLASRTYDVCVDTELDIFARFREDGTQKHRAFLRGTLETLPNPEDEDDASDDDEDAPRFLTMSLAEATDMKPIACFGNYLAFRLRAHNALTEFMAAPYIDRAFGAMDPDELANVSVDQFSKYVCCLHEHMPADEFEDLKDDLQMWLAKILASPLRNGDEIVVPTGCLFIESLVDPNPLLEDFKLKHRELDVFKVQEEVRKAGLENLRLAARLINKEREDPQIDKKISVDRSISPGIVVDEQ